MGLVELALEAVVVVPCHKGLPQLPCAVPIQDLFSLFGWFLHHILQLFKIEDDFHSYVDALTEALTGLMPFEGCET
jgi:hypothetical protein